MGLMQGIRDHAKGWIAWIVVGFISIPFALWGIQEYFNPNPNVAVAEVEGTEIDLASLRRAIQRERIRLQSMFGADLDPSRVNDALLRSEALERLIEDELLVQAGRRHGLTVSDQLLAARINSESLFREDGRFSQEAYERWLRSQGYSAGGFEQEFRRTLLTSQLYTGIAESAFVTGRELEEALRLAAQERDFSRLVVPVSRFDEVEIPESRIREHYERNRDRMLAEERVVVRYVELSRDDVEAQIRPDEDELRRMYEASRINFSVPEQRRARHILITLDAEAGATAVAAARAELEDLERRIEQGADFAALAEAHSQDPGSADLGGDLGFFGPGIMDAAFEAAVFEMSPRERRIVRTPFGLHLIELTDVRAGRTRTFEEARDELLRAYRRERSEALFFGQAEQLANLGFEHPDTLEVAAEALGLEIRETEPFGRDGANAGLAAEPEAVEAAFSPDVLEDGNNSEALQLSGDRIVVLRVAEHRPARPLSYEEARPRILEALRAEEARARARALGEQVLARLRAGEDAAEVAAAHGLEWQRESGVTRDASVLGPDLTRALFRMPPPPGGAAASYAGDVARAGDFVVLALHAVRDGDPAEVADSRRQAMLAALRRDRARAAFGGFVRSLRERARIEVRDAAER